MPSARGGGGKKMFLYRSRCSPDTIQNALQHGIFPFLYTSTSLSLLYNATPRVFICPDILYICSSAQGIPGARMLLLVSPVWWSERCMRAGMRPAAATGMCIVTAGVRPASGH
jgi:hypothetical protein